MKGKRKTKMKMKMKMKRRVRKKYIRTRRRTRRRTNKRSQKRNMKGGMYAHRVVGERSSPLYKLALDKETVIKKRVLKLVSANVPNKYLTGQKVKREAYEELKGAYEELTSLVEGSPEIELEMELVRDAMDLIERTEAANPGTLEIEQGPFEHLIVTVVQFVELLTQLWQGKTK